MLSGKQRLNHQLQVSKRKGQFPVGGGTSDDESITPLGSRRCSGYMTHSVVLDGPCLIKMDWGDQY